MATKQKLLGAAAGFGTDDPEFQQTVLLLDFDGTSGDANNTFTDSSTNNLAASPDGTVVQGSFSPYGDNWSNYFDGSGDQINVPDSNDLDFGTGTFTVELWFYIVSQTNNDGIISKGTGGGDGWQIIVGNNNNRLKFIRTSGNASNPQITSGDVDLGKWYHLALTRDSSNDVRLFLNGTQEGTYSDSTSWDSTSDLRIGTNRGQNNDFHGYISNVRVIKGTALYTANFTPPYSPLSAVTNTKLLTSQSNRFVDNSSTAASLTLGGTPKVTPFSPFKNSGKRTLTADGGSVYFDGGDHDIQWGASGDLALGSGDWSVETWFYMNSYPSASTGSFLDWRTLGSSPTNVPVANLSSAGYVNWYGSVSSGIEITSSTPLRLGEWTHIAIAKSGTTTTMYFNGESVGSFSDTRTYAAQIFGMANIQTNYGIDSYYSDLRIVIGTTAYTGSFTPPTAPLGSAVGSAYSLVGASYDSKSFDAQTQVSNAVGLQFNSDGTKMYVLDGTDSELHQYSLSTGFDVSTASYDSVSFDLSSQESGTLEAFNFKPDGTRMYAIGRGNDKVFQYDLSTAFDISTASYVSSSSTLTQEAAPQGLAFNSDGTKAFTVGTVNDTVYEYDLSTAYDASTMSYSGSSFSVSSQDGTPRDLAFNSSGTKMFIMGDQYNNVRQYSLSTAFDISTASYDSVTFGVGGQETAGKGIAWSSDGTAFYVIGSSQDTAFQYSVFSESDLLASFQDAGIYDLTGTNNLDTVGDARLGFAPIYGTGSLEFDGTGDYLLLENNMEVFEFGSGDFTIEFWLYPNDVSSNQTIFDCRPNSTNGAYATIVIDSTSDIRYRTASSEQIISSSISASSWIHVALCRSGTSTKLFIDGTQEGSTYSDSQTYLEPTRVVIGAGSFNLGGNPLDGYIDDLRVTKGIARYTSDFTPPTAIDLSTDTYAEYVTLFLDGDGPANGQNNTFTDSSTNDFTVTESGSVVQGVFSPYGDNWSVYFNGGDYLNTATTSVLSVGTSTDFTAEVFFLSDGGYVSATYDSFMAQWPSGGPSGSWILGLNAGGLPMFMASDYSSSARLMIGTTDVTDGKWHHIAVTRNGDVYRLFVDGTQEATVTNSGYNVGRDSTAVYINAYQNNTSANPEGWSSNHRFVSGTALYTSSFTPPTTPLTAVTGTQLLTTSSNRFQDESSNDLGITATQTPEVSRFSPFESDKPYNITTDGGSGYFDGSDLLTTSISAIGSGDLTIEFWAMLVNDTTGRWVAGTGTGSGTFQVGARSGGQWSFYGENNVQLLQGTTSIKQLEWYHVAVSRSSSTIKLFVNGVEEASTSNSTNFTATSLGVGGYSSSNASVIGFVSDFRIVIGSGIYTSDFTPPTAPLTAVTNTDFLLNFQDSAIPDLSGINNIDTVGNAKVGRSDPTKYGSNSLQLDGSGDWLVVPSKDEMDLGTADFTWEAWVWADSATTNNWYDSRSGTGTSDGFMIGTSSSQLFFYTANAIRIQGTPAFTGQTWNHVAVSRESGTTKLFLNGTQIGSSYSDSNNYTQPTIYIGRNVNAAGQFNGYIDDLRITKGVARYTANFTPPIKALPKY